MIATDYAHPRRARRQMTEAGKFWSLYAIGAALVVGWVLGYGYGWHAAIFAAVLR